MNKYVWIAILAGAALAAFMWFTKKSDADTPVDCSKLPPNKQAACKGHIAMPTMGMPANVFENKNTGTSILPVKSIYPKNLTAIV